MKAFSNGKMSELAGLFATLSLILNVKQGNLVVELKVFLGGSSMCFLKVE